MGFIYKKEKINGYIFCHVAKPDYDTRIALITKWPIMDNKLIRHTFSYGEGCIIDFNYYVSFVDKHNREYRTLAFSSLRRAKEWLETHWDNERFQFANLPQHNDHVMTTYFAYEMAQN